MSIGFRTSSSGDIHTPGATTVITKPTGFASTDILIAVFGSGNTSATGSWTPPTGWTAINTHFAVTGTQGVVDLCAFWALGSVASVTFTKSGTIGDVGWVSLAFTGVDNTTPIDATGTTNSNTATASLTTNAVTVATANAWHCIAMADWLGGTTSATGFNNVENAATNESAMCLYNTTPKSTGSTGTVAVADSAAAANQILLAMPFALRPAVAGGGVSDPRAARPLRFWPRRRAA